MQTAPPPAPTTTAFGFSLGGAKPVEAQPVAPVFSLAPATGAAAAPSHGGAAFDLDDLDSLLSGNAAAAPAPAGGLDWAEGLGAVQYEEEEDEEGLMPEVRSTPLRFVPNPNPILASPPTLAAPRGGPVGSHWGFLGLRPLRRPDGAPLPH